MSTVLGGLLLFVGLGLLVYRLGGHLAPGTRDQDAKRQPYACGQDLAPAGEQLSYGRFFRLALLFLVAHIAALIAMLLSLVGTSWLLAVIYLAGVGLCVQILTAETD
jgi:NADH:ubiquinone oxidoreductase subunit 3 (subunit A)